MSRPLPRLLAAALAAVAVCGVLACITINVYFPEAAVKNLSEQIESQVRERAKEIETEGEGEGGTGPEAPGTESSLRGEDPATRRAGLARFASPAPLGLLALQSGVPAPDVTSPTIQRIIDSRAQRLGDIRRFKELGVLGESNEAQLVVRELSAVEDLKQRAQVQRLVKEENADRERLFEEIANIKNVDRSQLPRIRETYAETLRAKARPGDWIQRPDGEWVRAK